MDPQIRADRVLAAIRSVPMFRGLAQPDQLRLATISSIRDLKRGDYLWREGDPPEHFTIVLAGQLKVVREGETADVIYELFGEGEPIGAIAVYNYMPYPAAAIALESASLLMVPRRDWFELLDRNPEFARAIIRELTRLVLALTRKLDDMRGQTVETRIAQLFLTLAERMGRETKQGTEIRLQLTRQEVADLVGTTVESAIRVLSRWGREGVLVTGEKRFVIPSRERLRECLSGGTPTQRGPVVG
jgi:CRP/FNR family transcriptional regulator